MFSKEHEQEITDYLIFHRLPLDILVEVKDHMISQIADIQMEENVGFDEAFLKTKKLWGSEFKMTKYSVFYSEEIPVIVKKIAKARYNNILKKSLLLGLISFAVNILLIFLANNEEVYSTLFKIQNGLFVLFTFGVWFFNRKIWKYVKQDFKYRGRLFYSMYQQNTALLVVSMASMAQVISKKGVYPYLFFRTSDHSEIIFVLATLVLPYCIQVMIIFGLMNFFEHKKSLEKMKEFLNLSAE